MKKDLIAYNTYLVTFENQKELCKTMLRFQEYYESPKFAGCIFSLEEFKNWYRNENGKFSYYSDWNGFNIPGYILDPFYNGEFNNITDEEQDFLDLFDDVDEDFYIISIHKNENGSYLHELIHAMYYHQSEYKSKVNKTIQMFHDTKYVKELTKYLKEIGYTKEVIYDEINAYTVCDEKLIGTRIPEKLKKKLQYLAEIEMVKFQS